MQTLEEARSRLLSAMPILPAESLAANAALGRINAESVLAPLDLPPFDNSAMDGYAVRASDVHAAGPDQPVPLQLVGQVAAGAAATQEITPGTCVRIFTGSPLPPGADAVVMQEDTAVESTMPGQVRILDQVKPWENVRLRGEDVRKGSCLIQPGERVTAGRAGLLAACGITTLKVHRQPVVGLISTGTELVEAGQPLRPGQIYESNRAVLATLMKNSGAIPRAFPLVPDTAQATRNALAQAFEACDLVVTSGGVSVGELDFVKPAFETLGGTQEFWKVSIKPGKPFVLGRWGQKFLFGLPGNPVSAVVTFLLLVRPALWKCQGATEVLPEQGSCRLAETLVNSAERRHFVRVHVDAEGRARSTGAQASHLLRGLSLANGLVDVPAQTTLVEGSIVPVLRFGD